MRTHCSCCIPKCPVAGIEMEVKGYASGKCGFVFTGKKGDDHKTYLRQTVRMSKTQTASSSASATLKWICGKPRPNKILTGARSSKGEYKLSASSIAISEYDPRSPVKDKNGKVTGIQCKQKMTTYSGVTSSVSTSSGRSKIGNRGMNSSSEDKSSAEWSTDPKYNDPKDDPDKGILGKVTEKTTWSHKYKSHDDNDPGGDVDENKSGEDTKEYVPAWSFTAWHLGYGEDWKSNGTTLTESGSIFKATLNKSYSGKTDMPYTYCYHWKGRSSNSQSGTYTKSMQYSNEFTNEDLEQLVKEQLKKQEWREPTPGFPGAIRYEDKRVVPKLDDNGEYVYKDHDGNPKTPKVQVFKQLDELKRLTLAKARFRLVVPHDFDPPPKPARQKWHGTWHEAEVWVVFHESAPWGGEAPQPVLVDRHTLIWHGPGEELHGAGWDSLSDEGKKRKEDTWKSDWIELDVPDKPGHYEVRVRRDRCYHGAKWNYRWRPWWYDED